MDDDAREYVQAMFDRAEREELEPEWHDDGLGFSILCPGCKGTPEEHRGNIRPFEPIVIVPLMLPVSFVLPRTPNDSATGPAA